MKPTTVRCRFWKGRTALARGYEVEIAGIALVVHRAINPDGSFYKRTWIVTEPITGMSISPLADTREEAIRSAGEVIAERSPVALKVAAAKHLATEALGALERDDPDTATDILSRCGRFLTQPDSTDQQQEEAASRCPEGSNS